MISNFQKQTLYKYHFLSLKTSTQHASEVEKSKESKGKFPQHLISPWNGFTCAAKTFEVGS